MTENRVQAPHRAPLYAKRAAEQRESERFNIDMTVSVSSDADSGGLIVSAAKVEDISRTGICLSLNQHIPPSQAVRLAMPTSLCPEDMHMPEVFVGPAKVVRLADSGNGATWIGLRLGDSFYQNMEFTLFMEYLQSLGHMGPILSETD